MTPAAANHSYAACIEIGLRPDRPDSHANRLMGQAREAGISLPDGLRSLRGYSLRIDGDEEQAHILAERLLADPVMNTFRVFTPDDSPGQEGTRRLEIVRLPGVMDPTSQSVIRAASHLGISVCDVRSWEAFLLPEGTSDEILSQLGNDVLANAAIEEIRIDPPLGIPPTADLEPAPFERVTVSLDGADEAALLELSEQGCLALDGVEMRSIQGYFEKEGRDPTDIELETLAQTWSEHCKHKTLTGLVDYEGEIHDNLLKSTIVRATHELDRDFCKSVFVDNAGVIAFDDNFHLTCKVETHNHPSAIEPYGGAGTGLGGVIRDTMGTGLGAKPVASTDVFCFGPPDLPPGDLPKGCLHPLRVLKGVVSGVRDYGNRMGIPTVNGAVCFDERYVGNPLVYCGSVGILPTDRLEKESRPGDLILVVGGRTGRDGIHGATFSSLELHEESGTVSSGAVQIGNAIEEKRMLDALILARDRNLYSCVTDCGAGGLSSAVGEMGETIGAHVILDRVPLKYHGLSYSEIWISEAQERMVLAVPPEHEEEILQLFASEDVEATVIGDFNDTGRLTAESSQTEVMNLDMAFLHEGLPQQSRKAQKRQRTLTDPDLDQVTDPGQVLLDLLASPNIASKEWIVRQYDHEVQGGSAIKPLVGAKQDGPGDGAVVAPVLGSRHAFALGCGINPCLGDVDPYQMALHAMDESLRNIVAVGGDPSRTAILDNFAWGGCDDPENLGDLVEACKACYDGAMAYGTPFISGKDSLNNDYRVGGKRQSIPPTLLITALAMVDDIHLATTMDFKGSGHALVLVGDTGPELGGSHLARHLGTLGTEVPPVDLKTAPVTLLALHHLLKAGLAVACHDLSEGGLGVAAAEMGFAGGVGAEIDLSKVPCRGEVGPLVRLYGESPTRFLLEVETDQLSEVEAALGDIPHSVIGETTEGDTFTVRDGDASLLDQPIESLRQAFLGTLDFDRGENAP